MDLRSTRSVAVLRAWSPRRSPSLARAASGTPPGQAQPVQNWLQAAETLQSLVGAGAIACDAQLDPMVTTLLTVAGLLAGESGRSGAPASVSDRSTRRAGLPGSVLTLVLGRRTDVLAQSDTADALCAVSLGEPVMCSAARDVFVRPGAAVEHVA